MKRILGFLIFILLMGCASKNDKGVINVNVKYTNNLILPKSGQPIPDKLYSGYGDYVGSITPTKFSAKFASMVFQNYGEEMERVSLVLISPDMQMDAPERFADFTNNGVVSFRPQLWQRSTKLVENREVELNYFYFTLHYFYQELNLPEQYNNVELNDFETIFHYGSGNGDSARSGSLVKSDFYPFVDRLFATPPFGVPHIYVFGNTDSTFVFNLDGKKSGYSIDNPLGGTDNGPIVRSNKYNPIRIVYSENKDLNINATATFDYRDLIQIYAGWDNIPYTKDDVFLYAPNFWERLSVKVEQY